MVGLPRAIIKKYGVTKKAWSVFRGSSSSRSKTRKKTTGGYMAKKHGFRRSKGGLGGMLKPLLIGAIGGYASRYAPVDIPFKTHVFGAGAAYAIGGRTLKSALLGAVGAQAQQMLMGGTSGSSQGIILN